MNYIQVICSLNGFNRSISQTSLCFNKTEFILHNIFTFSIVEITESEARSKALVLLQIYILERKNQDTFYKNCSLWEEKKSQKKSSSSLSIASHCCLQLQKTIMWKTRNSVCLYVQNVINSNKKQGYDIYNKGYLEYKLYFECWMEAVFWQKFLMLSKI